MATRRGMELLAGRAMADPEFRARLRADPGAAATEVHVRLTEADVAFISGLDWRRLDRLAEEFEATLPHMRAAWGGSLARPAQQVGHERARPAPRGTGRGRAPR